MEKHRATKAKNKKGGGGKARAGLFACVEIVLSHGWEVDGLLENLVGWMVRCCGGLLIR